MIYIRAWRPWYLSGNAPLCFALWFDLSTSLSLIEWTWLPLLWFPLNIADLFVCFLSEKAPWGNKKNPSSNKSRSFGVQLSLLAFGFRESQLRSMEWKRLVFGWFIAVQSPEFTLFNPLEFHWSQDWDRLERVTASTEIGRNKCC